MRLLSYGEDGCLKITIFDDDAIPPYAILSHTWGADTDEVTFADLAKGDGNHEPNYKKMFRNKKKPSYKKMPGYKKIRFCGEQAQQDGLQYFWVDTCCIDKSHKAELFLAIQSVFRWYQNAMKCYVYLSDVSTKKGKASGSSTEIDWEHAFRSSGWFTRGWTFQELLTSSIVEFFSQEWKKLGGKMSLKSLINKTTSIPPEALEGTPLSQFSVNERLRWREGRTTKNKEDGAYSLLGIFGVDLAKVYGEGEAGALGRLKREIDISQRCLRDTRSTDPCDDKKRIEDTKGGLLADSYRWVLDNIAFQQWQQKSYSQPTAMGKGGPWQGQDDVALRPY
jgi:hypothetical protein